MPRRGHHHTFFVVRTEGERSLVISIGHQAFVRVSPKGDGASRKRSFRKTINVIRDQSPLLLRLPPGNPQHESIISWLLRAAFIISKFIQKPRVDSHDPMIVSSGFTEQHSTANGEHNAVSDSALAVAAAKSLPRPPLVLSDLHMDSSTSNLRESGWFARKCINSSGLRLCPYPSSPRAIIDRSSPVSRQGPVDLDRQYSDSPTSGQLPPEKPAPSGSPDKKLSTLVRVAPPVGQRSDSSTLSPSVQTYLSEFRHDIWFLDRNTEHSDLLIVRIGEDGKILEPILVFKTEDWRLFKTKTIFDREQAWLPRGITIKPERDQPGHHHSMGWEYFGRGTRFVAIVPLGSLDYSKQTRIVKEEDRLYEPLETLLGLSELLLAADNESKKWCRCRAEHNKFSTSMILCANKKCKLGWYHKRCMGMDEDEEEDEWLCRQCSRVPMKELKIANHLRKPYGDFDTASSSRLHRARTFYRAWKKHHWPSSKQMTRLFDTVGPNVAGLSEKANLFTSEAPQLLFEYSNWVVRETTKYDLILSMVTSRKQRKWSL